MSKNYAQIDGVDDLFVNIHGRFTKQLDDYFFGRNSTFIKEIDKASAKVFKSMAVGSTVMGERAYPVMGVYHSLPSFLSPYTEEWEPLSKDYVKRKKRLMGNHQNKGSKSDIDRVRTTAFWEYKGTLKRYFQHNSERLSRISDNAMRSNATATQVGYNEHIFSDVIKKTNVRFKISAGLTNKGESRYDFKYNPTGEGRPIGATYGKGSPKSGMPVTSQALSSIRRSVQFDLFRGLQKHLEAMAGRGTAPSPEDYIAGIQTSTGQRMQQIKGTNQYLTSDLTTVDASTFKNTSIGLKLSYQKNGKTKYRGLVTPYMRYYANRVLQPIARKLINQGNR